MKFEVKLSTLFWLFVWPICPVIGIVVAVRKLQTKKWGGGRYFLAALSSLFLTGAYVVVLILSLVHGYATVTYADTVPPDAEVAEGFAMPITVRIQYRPAIEFLPWSLPPEEVEYVRCVRYWEVWWINPATQQRVDGEWAQRAYSTYCWNRDQEKREREEAETIQTILEHTPPAR